MDHLGAMGPCIVGRSGLCKTNEEKITLPILSSSYVVDMRLRDGADIPTRLVQNENQRTFYELASGSGAGFDETSFRVASIET